MIVDLYLHLLTKVVIKYIQGLTTRIINVHWYYFLIFETMTIK